MEEQKQFQDNVVVTHNENATIIWLSGDLNNDARDKLEQLDYSRFKDKIIIDLKKAKFLSSIILDWFVKLYKKQEHEQKPAPTIIECNDEMKVILKTMNLDKLFKI